VSTALLERPSTIQLDDRARALIGANGDGDGY